MKKIIRLTESELHGLVARTVKRIIREDVLGDNWHEAEEDKENVALNNYEPFESQEDHNWGGVGEEDIDPSYYEDYDKAMVQGWNDEDAEGYEEDPDWYRDDVMGIDSNWSPSDGDLYAGRA